MSEAYADIMLDGNIMIKNLSEGSVNTEYIISDIKTDDPELKNFLFSLGCYEGEKVKIISRLAGNLVISVKNARYSIGSDLAEVIII
ncbi:FeoA family protein [Spirochaeta isovalerica]|uniref:Ferrous iron transport protein A n=1 Tax=Spirochaeta isovalerica TaxID=150 RepID=A0A841REV7_9SPIO|nr:FeoA family protein [Spirochaeta isovalerica]MBB6482523.1 ferrous iron transport protein A [Spirochaeta isovalerica]